MDSPISDNSSVPAFAAFCKNSCESLWQASFEHPFVQALVDGTLSTDRFRFYQMQDARYLEAFADACSLISVKMPAPGDKLWFIDGARLAIVVEQELHTEYGKKLGYTSQDIAELELTPNNLAYQNHIVTSAARGSLVEALAALAPCPWLYTDIGLRIKNDLGPIPPEHPYANWLATYADPSFVAYTNDFLSYLQRAAESASESELTRATKAFEQSVQYEWMFWDQAWHKQVWPLSHVKKAVQ